MISIQISHVLWHDWRRGEAHKSQTSQAPRLLVSRVFAAYVAAHQNLQKTEHS